MKRIISAVLVILMIFSMTSMVAFNADVETEVEVSVSYVINEETVVATVSIDNTTNRAVSGFNVVLKFDTDKLEYVESNKGSFIKNNGNLSYSISYCGMDYAIASNFNMVFADPYVGEYDDSDSNAIVDKRDLGKGKGDIAIVSFRIKSGAAITECPFEIFGKDGYNGSIIDVELRAFTASYTIVAPAADYTSLDAAIADAEVLVEADYIADSWAEVVSALSTARAAKDFDVFKQAEVDAAAAALVIAIGGLKAVALTGIEVTAFPTKSNYFTGDSFDSTGLVVTASYNNGSTETVTAELSTPDMTTAGTKTVTVTYGEFTDTFDITVTQASPPIIKGDVNLSGDITIADALALFKHVASVALITDADALKVADIDGNSGVTIADALTLFKYVAGVIPEL